MYNNQFATQFLREESEDSNKDDAKLKAELVKAGTKEEVADNLIEGIKSGKITKEDAFRFIEDQKTLEKNLEEEPVVKELEEMSATGGGVTAGGATFTPGPGEPYASPRAFGKVKRKVKRKYQEDIEYEAALKDALLEHRFYSRFKNEISVRPQSEQIHQATKIIEKKLREVTKLLEFTSEIKKGILESNDKFEYKKHTKAMVEKIHSSILEMYSKLKELK